MKDVLNIWEPMYDDFIHQYGSLAKNIIEWGPLSETELIMKDREGQLWLYDTIDYSVVPYFIRDDLDLEETEWRERFSTRLRHKLRKVGITRNDLSDMTGISTVTLSAYLNAKSTPSVYNLDKIVRALNCSLRYLTKF